ncbi:Protein of uncharacterised function (DUF1659) [Megamonas hypermegale]|uniref:Protein of uncharacterized function (DUF1659) n=1 Tax=Megamonas hypermegale TaxID=158847 RepID=A0A239T6V6_9FIRM|nr:DUF1659 domain-containing protein [Megamonas hypermegale]SNU93461.1 Protein of uncharacterised function (DUF1659) [Megamonas hypermegale]
MAVKKNVECNIVIKVQTGTTTTGKPSYASRSFGDINPEISDDNVLTIGQKLSGLQKYTLGSVNREDLAEIAQA